MTGITGTTRTARARVRRRASTGTALGALGAAALLLLAACGSGGSGGSASGAPRYNSSSGGTGSQQAAQKGSIATRSTKLGNVLVDPRGMTLYAFAADRPHKSLCDASCIPYWPPVPGADAAAVARSGVKAKLGTVTRTDGSSQLTANGFPMYTYVGDTTAGQTNGQGLNLSGGLWWAVAPTGGWIKAKGASTATGGSSGSARGGY